MDTWTKIKKVLNKLKGKEISRSRLHAAMECNPRMYSQGTPVDNYRCLLEKAGYLVKYSRGVYKMKKFIPNELTVNQAREQAYGNKVVNKKTTKSFQECYN